MADTLQAGHLMSKTQAAELYEDDANTGKMGAPLELTKDGHLLIRAIRDDERRIYRVPREETALIETLLNLQPQQVNRIGAAINWVRRAIQWQIKAAPSFILQVGGKDMVSYMQVSRQGLNKNVINMPNILHSLHAGMRSIRGKNIPRRQRDAAWNGMLYGYGLTNHQVFLKRSIEADSLYHKKNALVRLAIQIRRRGASAPDILDVAPRMTEYNAMRKAGKTPLASAADASQIFDHSRQGASTIAKIGHMTIPFWNAMILSAPKVWELYVSDTARLYKAIRTGKATRAQVSQFTQRVLMQLMSLIVAQGLLDLMDDEELSEDISDRDKSQAYWIPYKKDSYHHMVAHLGRDLTKSERLQHIGYVKIPIWFEVGAVTFALAQLIRDGETKGDKTAQIYGALLRQLSPYGVEPWPLSTLDAIMEPNKRDNRNLPTEVQTGRMYLPTLAGRKLGIPADAFDRLQQTFFPGLINDAMLWADDQVRPNPKGIANPLNIFAPAEKNLALRAVVNPKPEMTANSERFYTRGRTDKILGLRPGSDRARDDAANRYVKRQLEKAPPGDQENVRAFIEKNYPDVYAGFQRGTKSSAVKQPMDLVNKAERLWSDIVDSTDTNTDYERTMDSLNELGHLAFQITDAVEFEKTDKKGDWNVAGISYKVQQIQANPNKEEAMKSARRYAEKLTKIIKEANAGLYGVFEDIAAEAGIGRYNKYFREQRAQ